VCVWRLRPLSAIPRLVAPPLLVVQTVMLALLRLVLFRHGVWTWVCSFNPQMVVSPCCGLTRWMLRSCVCAAMKNIYCCCCCCLLGSPTLLALTPSRSHVALGISSTASLLLQRSPWSWGAWCPLPQVTCRPLASTGLASATWVLPATCVCGWGGVFHSAGVITERGSHHNGCAVILWQFPLLLSVAWVGQWKVYACTPEQCKVLCSPWGLQTSSCFSGRPQCNYCHFA
jgi:hypothetical protein